MPLPEHAQHELCFDIIQHDHLLHVPHWTSSSATSRTTALHTLAHCSTLQNGNIPGDILRAPQEYSELTDRLDGSEG
jgi:hypothetical protein